MRIVKNKSKEKSTIRKLLKYFSLRKRTLLLTVTCATIWAFVRAISPFITGLAFDVIYDSLEKGELANIKVLEYILILVLIAIFAFLAQSLAVFFGGNLHQGTYKKLREDVFDSLQRQSHKYFGDHSTGELISRSTSDIQRSVEIFWIGLNQTVLDKQGAEYKERLAKMGSSTCSLLPRSGIDYLINSDLQIF